MFPNYQLKIADFYNTTTSSVKKMLPKFSDRAKYALYYENLQLYLRLGLKLKKYPVLEFNQSQWLKPYLEFNT